MTEAMTKYWKAILAVLALCAGVMLYVANLIDAHHRLLTIVERSALHDYVRDAPVIGRAQILLANVQYDDTGRYTAEIREMLRQHGKPYRMLRREYEDEDAEGNLDRLAALLNRHRSVLLLEGAVSANGESIRIRIRNRDGRIDERRAIELNGQSPWTDDLGRMVVEATQELIDNMRVDLATLAEHEELAATIRDAHGRSETDEEKAQTQFQLAYVESDIAFFNRDAQAMSGVLETYQKLLETHIGEYQEGPLRINIGVAYENLGEMLEDEEFFDKAKDEYAEAARVFERLGHVEKALKAKTARFRIERREWFQRAGRIGEDDLSRLIEMRDTIEKTLSLHGREISGWQGYLSNQERIYIDLLLAAATRDEAKYSTIRSELVAQRRRFLKTVTERGGLDNWWVRHVLLSNEEWQAEELWARGEVQREE